MMRAWFKSERVPPARAITPGAANDLTPGKEGQR
jgi:hypothetical protein